MHYLYIIYSKKIDRYYVGESIEVSVRLGQHNSHYFKNGYTKAAEDWEVVLQFGCASKKEALYLERFIKKMKSKVFIEKIVTTPAILINLLKKYRP